MSPKMSANAVWLAGQAKDTRALWLKRIAAWLVLAAIGAVAVEARSEPVPVPALNPTTDELVDAAIANLQRAQLAVCLVMARVPYDKVVKQLGEKFGEEYRATEYLSPLAVAELWVNPESGSYTIIARSPTNRACLAMAGRLPHPPARKVSA